MKSCLGQGPEVEVEVYGQGELRTRGVAPTSSRTVLLEDIDTFSRKLAISTGEKGEVSLMKRDTVCYQS